MQVWRLLYLSSTTVCIAWQVVEEFMSIADGQLVLHPPTPHSMQTPGSSQQPEASEQQVGAHEDDATPAWQKLTGSNVDVSASVSRIGSRAYPPAMAMLAPSIRFDLAQAVDAQRFGTDRSETGLQHHHLQRAALLRAALAQPMRQPVPLEEQVTFFFMPLWLLQLEVCRICCVLQMSHVVHNAV